MASSALVQAAIPIEEFVAHPTIAAPVLSPSGRYLAVARQGDDKTTLVAAIDVDTPGAKPVGISFPAKTRVDWIAWASENRMLVAITTEHRITMSGSSAPAVYTYQSRIVAIDRDGKNQVILMQEERRVRGRADLTQIIHPLPQDPDHVLMAAYGGGTNNLYRVNVNTGESVIDIKGSWRTFQWLTDLNGKARVRWDGSTYGDIKMYVRRGDSDDWDVAAAYGVNDYPALKIVGFADDPSIAIVANRGGGDRFGLYEYNVAARTFGRAILQHPAVDVGWPVGEMIYDPYTTGLVGTCYVDDVWFCRYFDPALQSIQRAFEDAVDEAGLVQLISWSVDRKRFIVKASGPRNPGSYYLYDPAKGPSLLGRAHPRIPAAELGEMLVIKYPARDGTKIPGYLTLPPGKGSKNLPMVVMPHGGPELRDYVTFDNWAQMFANRGYAVFQPNFRGSGGYGKRYLEAGYRQWGRLMQDDITDGVKALIKDGTADPSRICIVGASYGGYAALAGGAFTPELYKCIVSISGVSDLVAMIENDRFEGGGRDSFRFKYWKTWVGDPRTDAQEMKAFSPVNHAAKFTAPVLLIHGREDDNVVPTQSLAMEKALKKAGKPVEYILVDYQGHSFVGPARLDLLKNMERFVATHIGK